jgi:hypothetical protein
MWFNWKISVLVSIVEDEHLIRMDAVHMIWAAGFDPVEAANSDEVPWLQTVLLHVI